MSLLLVAGAVPAQAQDTPHPVDWTLKDLRAGMCVEFLVDPAVAEGQVARRIPTPIESAADRFPVLARVAAAESTYHGWIPAEYCWFLYRSVLIGTRVSEVEDGRQPVMVGYLALAASPLPDSATSIAVGLFTNSTAIERAMVTNRLQIDLIHYSVGVIPDEEEDRTRARYEARHRGAIVQWDGGPGTPRSPEPQTIRMVGFTPTQSLHGISTSITPDSAFVASGNFRVIGNGELQRMLSTSPIRFLTSYSRGGDSEWHLGQ